MPEEEKEKRGICPICDSNVDLDTEKCPECKADLTVFGVKTGEEESPDVKIPEYEESLERLLGEIGEKDEKKEEELFEEIMAAVDKTNSMPNEEGIVEAAAGEAEEAAEGAVMFECPLCNTLVDESAKSCPGCGAVFAGEVEVTEGEGVVEQAEGTVEEGKIPAVETEGSAPVEISQPAEPAMPEVPPQEVPEKEAEIEGVAPPKPKRKFKIRLRRKKDRAKPLEEPSPEPPPAPSIEAKPPVPAVKDEKTLHKELAACVLDVKPLLKKAREFGVNIIVGRKMIDQAIAAGKDRDFERAIALVKESKNTIENMIKQHILDSIQTTQLKIDALRKAGADVNELENMATWVRSLLDERKYDEAIALAKNAAENAEKSVLELKASLKEKEQIERDEDVTERLKDLIELIKNGEIVNVNVKKAKDVLTQARIAMKRSEWNKAKNLLIEAKEDFLRELPKQLTEIISSSKPVLYNAKMQGIDIKPSIKLLKEASTSLKLNNYLDALEAIKRYKSEMNQYM